MDYEKKYKEALERAKAMIDDLRKGEDILAVSNLEAMFPELAESEDESIKNAIINHLTIMWGNSQDDICGVNVEDAIAWLEKQSISRTKMERGR